MQQNAGFTLIELMITIVVMVFLTTMAAPSMLSLMQNNRITQTTNDLVAALNLARSESIKRGSSVSVCAAATTEFNACGEDDDWNNGWLVFVDPNGDGVFAGGASEPLIKVSNTIATSATIATAPATNRATYTSSGFAAAATANLGFTISADGCVGNNQSVVTVSGSGRVTLAKSACP